MRIELDMAPHDHGTKVSFPAGAPEFDIPLVIQHLPVRKAAGSLWMLRISAHRRLTMLAPDVPLAVILGARRHSR